MISRFSENKRADANLLKDRKIHFYRFSSGKRTNSISNYKIENIKREAGQTIGAGSIARKRTVIRNIIKKDNRRKQRWKIRHRTRKKIS